VQRERNSLNTKIRNQSVLGPLSTSEYRNRRSDAFVFFALGDTWFELRACALPLEPLLQLSFMFLDEIDSQPRILHTA
jgi:hypothetical protein